MRGTEDPQNALFSYVSQEDRIPNDHPLRKVREIVNPMLKDMSQTFDKLYAGVGRPSIPPEQLLRALLVQIFYSIRSERLLMEELNYNLLFRWFVGLSMDDKVWDHSVFTKNRDRLLDGEIAQAFLEQVLQTARKRQLLSDEHFTVDGTLVEAWAGQKSFKQKDKATSSASKTDDDPGNPSVDFHGEKRRNDTHQSTTDPESRLYRSAHGKEAKLSFMGHLIMDNRHGLAVAARYTQATGKAEREAAQEMLLEDLRMRKRKKAGGRITLGADKGYDKREFVGSLQQMNVSPHVAQRLLHRGGSGIDGRTTRHRGYAISQRKRKLIEEIFGWIKTIGLMRKTRHKGLARGGWMFTFTVAAYDLIRIRNIATAAG